MFNDYKNVRIILIVLIIISAIGILLHFENALFYDLPDMIRILKNSSEQYVTLGDIGYDLGAFIYHVTMVLIWSLLLAITKKKERP